MAGRVARRRRAHQPRPAPVRRRRRDQARARRLPGPRERADPARARGPATVGDPRAPWAGGVHAEERPEVHARMGTDRFALGRELQARGHVRGLRRPPHAPLVREPACGRVPPGAHHRRRPAAPVPPDPRPRSAGGRRLRGGGAGGASRASGADRSGAGGRGEDERREGCARVRADRRGGDGGRRRRHACDRGARRGARPRRRHHCVHEGGSRGQGVRRPHARRRWHRGRGLQPAGASRRPGLVPGGVGRAGRGDARATSRSARRRMRSTPVPTAGRRGCRRRRRSRPALLEEGHAIPVPRVAAMHEGKRRARSRRDA